LSPKNGCLPTQPFLVVFNFGCLFDFFRIVCQLGPLLTYFRLSITAFDFVSRVEKVENVDCLRKNTEVFRQFGNYWRFPKIVEKYLSHFWYLKLAAVGCRRCKALRSQNNTGGNIGRAAGGVALALNFGCLYLMLLVAEDARRWGHREQHKWQHRPRRRRRRFCT
jgi:hypothetical protein